MGEYVLVDHNGCNGHEDINLQFVGFTISGRVMGAIGVETCPIINGGGANVNVELISTGNVLINAVFTLQGGSYTFTNITPRKYRLVASHHEHVNFIKARAIYKYKVISNPTTFFFKKERP